ncbi:MAG: hypothetical protein JO076_07780 [Verrucomicrobia bacterium]|nr:hypothetical protein [Verrucomicrobiota bacterium]
MPPPEVDIKTINVESPKREMKEEWLAENPGRVSADFETYRQLPESKSWEREIKEWTTVTGNYWSEQLPQVDVLKNLDVKLKVFRKFSDTTGLSSQIYDKLINLFGDNQFFGATLAVWKLPDAARPEWKKLVAKKEAQVQRSAQDLSSVISRTRVLANEEMSGANVNDPEAIKDIKSCISTLEGIEKALQQWDKLLSGSASPDRMALNDAAVEVHSRLEKFTFEHSLLFGKNTTPSYIKYEVLATVKAVSEKVTSQFSARVTEPDMTGMYSRIIDVPRSTPKRAATQAGKEISSSYQGDLNTFWDMNMGNLQQTAGRLAKLPNLGLELKNAIYNTSSQYPMKDSLNAFRDSYKAVGPNTLGWIPGVSSSVAEITFRIPKYQNAVEQVFAKYADNATAQGVRNDYRKFFDTVTQYMQNRVEVLQETMS